MLCRVCQTETAPFFSLGQMPLVNSFLAKGRLNSERKYDLTVTFCRECYLIQLAEAVSPEMLFSDYIYFSSTSSSLLGYFQKTADYLTERFDLGGKSLVLEIASNDGAMLQFFKKKGIGILGIDPAKNIANIANKNGIKTIPEFFNFSLAQKLIKDGVRADLIYGANVLAHVPGIMDFVRGVDLILKPEGTAIFEFPYIKGLFENKFDTIYHEHVFYYSLLAIKNLFSKAGMDVYDVEQIPTQGGSLRVFAAHADAFPISRNVRKLSEEELRSGFDRPGTYRKINDNVSALKAELILFLEKFKKEGKKVAAYGAPAKGIILLNYFGIKDYLSFIVDKSLAKQGLYTPGAHMPVYSLDKINEEKPDYLLVLCWNIFDEVKNMPELKGFKSRGGKFILPVPKVLIS